MRSERCTEVNAPTAASTTPRDEPVTAVIPRQEDRAHRARVGTASDAGRVPEPRPIELPTDLAATSRAEGRESWLASVPETMANFCTKWTLTVGPPFQPGGQTAWVAPARGADGADLVLKVMWRHPEAEHEADGLRVWAGNGAVRLQAAAELADTLVLLVERATPGSALSAQPEPRQDEVIAGLLRQLGVGAPPERPLRTR